MRAGAPSAWFFWLVSIGATPALLCVVPSFRFPPHDGQATSRLRSRFPLWYRWLIVPVSLQCVHCGLIGFDSVKLFMLAFYCQNGRKESPLV